MDYSISTIQSDLRNLEPKDFLVKYILRSENWYLSEYIKLPDNKVFKTMDEMKLIISKHLGLCFNNILMVGSGKIGCSLSPKNLFRKFIAESDKYPESDLDIAIVSSKIFDELWYDLKIAKYKQSISNYPQMTSSIFRGFINEWDFSDIKEIRKVWENKIDMTKKIISENLDIYHPIKFRIYRSWEDLEEYHFYGITKIKNKLLEA